MPRIVDARRRGAQRDKLAPLIHLRRVRHERHMTIRGLAARVGVSRELVRMLEHGYAPRTADVVDAIAKALNVSSQMLTAPVLETLTIAGGSTELFHR